MIDLALDEHACAAIARGIFPPSLQAEIGAEEGHEPYETILVRGYRISLSPLAVFNELRKRLAPEGMLALLIAPASMPTDEVTRRRHLDYLDALAQRCGLTPKDHCPIDEPGYHVVAYRKTPRPPRWQIDLLDDRNISGFASLFKDAFGAEISEPLWRWKYADGRGNGIIARRGERIIAHYGCTRRRALYFGRPIAALQMCDVMVDPRERGVMTKQGAMFLTTTTMLELYLGLEPADLAFGFPSGRHARLGERLGLYAEVERVVEVRWPVSTSRARLGTRVKRIEADEPDIRSIVDRLWAEMRRDLVEAIVVIRDWDYLTYRYLEHPHHRYDLVLITSRFTGQPLGLFVLRRVGDAMELLDFIGGLRHLPIALDQARRLASMASADSIFCWITEQHAGRFDIQGATIRDLDISVPTNTWVDGPNPETLRNKWWLMSGDAEFH